ncbi:HAD family hydrolase [Pseudomonas amygdali]|uniref:HAD family hydrolase n=1 Tax=Pseudomonas amygdali TaxID=47877 RepID=UPI00214BC3DB|nr:HAD family hydrolase [Pseudomonas amygdali]
MTSPAVDGVIFDAFGTVLRIGQRTNPYRNLLREGRRQGLEFAPDSIRIAMTTNHSIYEIASHLGIHLTRAKREELSSVLERELSSIQAFPDAKTAIALLRQAGVKVGICSNLAAPYGPVVRGIFPQLDGYAFSFELGVMKPAPAIYQSICSQMEVEPGHYFSSEHGRVLMIGDSEKCDQYGPRSIGVMGLHLNRNGQGPINDLQQFAELVIDQNRQFESGR